MQQHALDFGDSGDDLRLQIACDLLERFDDVAVIVDRIDDGGADAHVAFAEARHLQLPGQVFLQRFAAGVGKILRVIFAGPRRFGLPGDLTVTLQS